MKHYRSSEAEETYVVPAHVLRKPVDESGEYELDGIGSETRQRIMARMRAEDNWPGKAP